ncbi:hypothetical protein RI129_000135 [Pyrocoelia pectoralis]|uniref:HAT C-terminal dimerisation domain-containing protein n=1 Tax=Pyrocoelia pectoralis TaxID=417401 RepID=A0AAN7ZBT7_9COLE
MTHCRNLELALTNKNVSDINAIELADELSILSTMIPNKKSPSEVLQFISELNFAPNVSVALRILLTLPISAASGERSFSELKLIKNFLRTNTTQHRLSGLAMISIEHELCNSIDFNNIKIFRTKSAQKVILLMLALCLFHGFLCPFLVLVFWLYYVATRHIPIPCEVL